MVWQELQKAHELLQKHHRVLCLAVSQPGVAVVMLWTA